MNAYAPSWESRHLRVDISSPLEVRAEPDADGGWTIRSERSSSPAGTMFLGWLQATPQDYAIRLG